MITDWQHLDKGSERLILVGPLQKDPLQGRWLEDMDLASAPQVAIDGGSRCAVNPVLWAGDADSGQAPPSAPVFIKRDQDVTDLRFCLDGIHAWQWQELHLFGFAGERTDHALANVGEIHAEMKKRPRFSQAVFYNDKNRVQTLFFQAGKHRVNLQGIFSVMVLEPATLTISGACRYPAQQMSLSPLSGRGISNQASGAVDIDSSGPFMVLVP